MRRRLLTATDPPDAAALAVPQPVLPHPVLPHLVLIDGSGFIFRAYHALPPMTDPAGTPVNAVYGFANMLAKLLRDRVGTHMAVIFDAGRVTFRNRLYDAYKAHRPPPPDDLIPQFALVREATAAFGVPAIELADWEADDLIASYAACVVREGGQATIVSSDKDLMQLIGPGVAMTDPIKNRAIGVAEVMEKFGVAPGLLIEAQALIGDAVDNVPGVPGIGAKTAAQLLGEYGSLEGILAAAPGMKASRRRDLLIEHAAAARLSRELVTLRVDAPLPVPLTELAFRAPDREILGAFLGRLGFRSTAVRLNLAAEAPAVVAEVGASAAPSLPGVPSAAFGPYETICTEAALLGWIAEARRRGVVALTARADHPVARRARLIGLALAVAPGRAGYLPLRHTGDLAEGAPPQMDPEVALAALAPLLADPAVLKIAHNAKFEATLMGGRKEARGSTPGPWLGAAPPDPHTLEDAPTAVGASSSVCGSGGAAPSRGFGGETPDLPSLTPLDDTMLIAYALEAGAHGFGLEELSTLHLGHAATAHDEITGSGRARIPYDAVRLDRATAHMAELADITLRLWHVLKPRLRAEAALTLYEQIDRRLVPILRAMEQAGVKIDAGELSAMSQEFAARMAVMETEIHRIAGTPFNLGSPKQLGEMLFDTLGLTGGKRMKTGAWGTDAAVLQGLADEGHEIPARILEWRQLAKLKSTYADTLVEEIDPLDGRVHTTFGMANSSTGRLNSNDPNLQNIPIRTEEGARIRRVFIAEPGHLLLSADYSQIELRLLAHVADIPALRESFLNNEDIHARTASEVFNVPMARMDAATRRRAKAINFGIIYGISAFGLARQLAITPGDAKLYIDAYFARYPGIRDYMETTRAFARAHGYVLTPFGRKCWIPGITLKNPAHRAYAERQAINAPLQGGAADVIKRAMVRLPAALTKAGLSARLLLQVHDELLFEAPDAECDTLAEVARHTMQGAATLLVPLVVETGSGRTWSEAH